MSVIGRETMDSVTDPYNVEKVSTRLKELWSEALLSAIKEGCRTRPLFDIPGVGIKAIEDDHRSGRKTMDRLVATDADRVLCISCYEEGVCEQDPGTHYFGEVPCGQCESCGLAVEKVSEEERQ